MINDKQFPKSSVCKYLPSGIFLELNCCCRLFSPVIFCDIPYHKGRVDWRDALNSVKTNAINSIILCKSAVHNIRSRALGSDSI